MKKRLFATPEHDKQQIRNSQTMEKPSRYISHVIRGHRLNQRRQISFSSQANPGLDWFYGAPDD